jgi:DNA-directed RNA polymerase subunit RPC12/RpoP
MTADPKDIHCRACGARTPHLKGDRRPGLIHMTCKSCGNQWDRYPDSCCACGVRALVAIRVPLLQKARGTQQSIIGYATAYECTRCGAKTSNADAARNLNASA